MGEEKIEHNETKLSNQSGYSPVKQHEDIQEENSSSINKLTVDIPNGKHGEFFCLNLEQQKKNLSKNSIHITTLALAIKLMYQGSL